jgi:predicted PurR-regulated permease PerM
VDRRRRRLTLVRAEDAAAPGIASGRPLRFDLLNVALATAVAMLVIQAFHFIGLIQSVLFLMIFAVIVATAIEPIVVQLRALGLRRGYSVLVVFFFLVAAIVAFLFLMVEAVAAQLSSLATTLPQITTQLSDLARSLPAGPIRDAVVNGLGQAGTSTLGSAFSAIVSTGTLSGLAFATLGFLQTLFAVVTVLVIAYFWIAERLTIRRIVLHAVHPEHRERALEMWTNVESQLGAWARGQLVVMLIVGAMQGAGYAIFGVHFGLLLAVWAGLAEIIPMIGPYIGAAPAVLVALTQSPETALLVVGYTVVVNLVEANVLIPRIMEHAVGLSPLTVILALLIGGAIFGFVGALLAVPIAAAIQSVVVELVNPPKDATPVPPPV